MNGIKWFVYSNFWVALNVVAFYAYCTFILKISYDFFYGFLVFFATLFAYNFQRFLKISGQKNESQLSERHIWIANNQRQILILSMIGLLGMIIFAGLVLPLKLMLFSLPALLIVLFYARKNKNVKGVRNIPFLKIFIISLVWVFVVFIIPTQIEGWGFSMIPVDLLLIVYFFTFLLCIPFDIRDINHDKNHLKTLPVILGVNGSKMLAIVVMLIISIYTLNVDLWSMTITGIIVIITLILTDEKRSELFFTGWIDGMFSVLMLLQILIDAL